MRETRADLAFVDMHSAVAIVDRGDFESRQ